MKTVSHIGELSELGIEAVAVAFGVFDGVHLGHQQILAALCRLARKKNALPVLATFVPHPRRVLEKNKSPRAVTTTEQQLRLLADAGVKATVFLPFSLEMAQMPPLEFLEKYLLGTSIPVRGVCVGSQWRFGAAGRGDVRLLERIGSQKNFQVISVAEVMLDGEPISSTRIRSAVLDGDLELAGRLLGRPYSIHGHVSHGKGIGSRKLHCPTANVSDRDILLPPDGVYAARARVETGTRERWFAGIVYVGAAPTIPGSGTAGEDESILELHLFDFNETIYGSGVEVVFLDFIRPDRKFESAGKLKKQMQIDMDTARNILR